MALTTVPAAMDLTVTSETVEIPCRTGGHDRIFEKTYDQASLAAIKSGALIFVARVAPSSFVEGRSRKLCDLYARYDYTQFFVYYPGGPSANVTGRYLMVYFPDPTIKLEPDGPQLLSQCRGAPIRKTGAWREPGWFDITKIMHKHKPKGGYETNPDAAVQANTPYDSFVGTLIMVTDGIAQLGGVAVAGATSLDIGVDVMWRATFTENINRASLADPYFRSVELAAATAKSTFYVTVGAEGQRGRLGASASGDVAVDNAAGTALIELAGTLTNFPVGSAVPDVLILINTRVPATATVEDEGNYHVLAKSAGNNTDLFVFSNIDATFSGPPKAPTGNGSNFSFGVDVANIQVLRVPLSVAPVPDDPSRTDGHHVDSPRSHKNDPVLRAAWIKEHIDKARSGFVATPSGSIHHAEEALNRL
jgi:hypothetical protein